MIFVINPGCLLIAYFASSKCLLSLARPGHTSYLLINSQFDKNLHSWLKFVYLRFGSILTVLN